MFAVLITACGKARGICDKSAMRTRRIFVKFENPHKKSPEGRPVGIMSCLTTSYSSFPCKADGAAAGADEKRCGGDGRAQIPAGSG